MISWLALVAHNKISCSTPSWTNGLSVWSLDDDAPGFCQSETLKYLEV